MGVRLMGVWQKADLAFSLGAGPGIGHLRILYGKSLDKCTKIGLFSGLLKDLASPLGPRASPQAPGE